MAVEDNKSVSRRFLEELWNQKNVSIMDELLADTYIDHTPPLESSHEGSQGREAVKQLFEALALDFSDVRVSVGDQIAEVDKVTTLVTWECTQKDDTEPVTVIGVGIDRIDGGRIVENWNTFDALYRLLNLKNIPSPEAFAGPGTAHPFIVTRRPCIQGSCIPGFVCRFGKCWRV